MSEVSPSQPSDPIDKLSPNQRFEMPYRFRAFSDLRNLLPVLLKKQREVVNDPEDIETLNSGWNLILFTEDRHSLILPSLGSDEAVIHQVAYPNGFEPFFQIGLFTFADGSPLVVEEDHFEKKYAINGYNAIFGPEMEPFTVHYDNFNFFTDRPLGDQVARWQGKRPLSDHECEAIVHLIATNIGSVSNEITS